ncbi:C40 family peptidase [Paenibacillus sp. GP183]|jgi:gamma-D-glutamyl-L-lysine dipeptidyl-peptidase|uniref:C40 family peptidase n=1 Tax=Paenibacillus sp. GP183 TaxID=1882751 RepID=UPI00089BF0C0|nr:C40 family peptidase [Paenibacillus sp. GP183]SEB52349.1 Cell wall-associated hydrolase, NlpC family [Paenibacillus sp. GP183]
MNELKRMAAAVSVATVWTKPESPRSLDEPALKHPAEIREWRRRMTVKDKVDLSEANRVQTQILYGTSVLVVEEQEDWIKVLIPQQGTRKEALGYPGWVPRCQLVNETEAPAGSKMAEVISGHAWLYRSPSEHLIELSFLTSLPVLEETEEWVKVQTPEGIAYLKADEVRLIEAPSALKSIEGHIGRGIVEQGKRFLNLPYLWGGMSSFGYDCSGFAYSMHRFAGISIPRDTSDQAIQGALIEKEQLEPGDLLFFAHEEGKGAIHHVGIYAGDQRMIHSPESIKAIEIVDLDSFKLAKEHCVSRRYWG